MLATRTLRAAVSRAAIRSQFSTPRSVSTLVLADHDNSSLNETTLSAITASKQLGGTTTVLVAGSGCSSVAEAAAKVAGVDAVCLSDIEALDKFMPETATGFLCDLIKSGGFTHVVGTTSTKTKAVLPRVAALMDVQPITDVIGIESEDTFTRPIYAGNAIATVKSSDSLKLMTVRPTNFDKAAAEGGSGSIASTDVGASADDSSKWISQELSKSDRPDLQSAGVVISGGRAMKSGENFGLLDPIADKLKAAVGASRAAVDAGFVPNDMQIGQTGKVVAPDLYIAVGISGAIQHLAGMKDSKVIVAINKDPDAPIFQVADYGLVADLFTALPELDEKLPGVL